MVSLVKSENKSKKADPITKKTFLSSLLTWYPEGVPCCVDTISKVFTDYSGDPSICVTLYIEEMEKCRMRDIDENGEIIKIVDEFGEESDKIIVDDASGFNVPLFFKLKLDENSFEDNVFIVHDMSAIFPLLNYGCIEREMISSNNKQGLSIEYDEILDALSGLEFIAKSERIVPSNPKIKPFNRLVVDKRRDL